MGKSTATRRANKPGKPYPTFPLYPHASGRWAKKILGKVHYFGRWGVKEGASIVPVADPKTAATEAKAEFDRQAPALYAGKKPEARPDQDGPDVFELRESFLSVKQAAVDSGKLSPRTFARYKDAADLLLTFFGAEQPLATLNAADFTRLHKHIDRGVRPVSLSNDIRHLKIVLKFAYDSEMIDRPYRYGTVFKAPVQAVIRRDEQAHKQEHGKRLIDAPELRIILDALAGRGEHALPRTHANLGLRAMVLLGVNGGLGQTDCANLQEQHLHLGTGWMDFPRVKTAVERRIPLWPETVEAIREAMAVRPRAKSPADRRCVFITGDGIRWVHITKAGHATDSVGMRFKRVLTALDLKRARLNFYALRHVCETIGGRARDQVAMNAIMGHAPATGDMASKYIEEIGDDRLLAVTNTIREWLFANTNQEKTT